MKEKTTTKAGGEFQPKAGKEHSMGAMPGAESYLHGSGGARIEVMTYKPDMPDYGNNKAKMVQTGGVQVDHAGAVPAKK